MLFIIAIDVQSHFCGKKLVAYFLMMTLTLILARPTPMTPNRTLNKSSQHGFDQKISNRTMYLCQGLHKRLRAFATLMWQNIHSAQNYPKLIQY